jgi:hypothetical protein
MSVRRLLLGSVVIPAILAGMTTSIAVAQEAPAPVQSLSVRPVGTTENDPNGGQWFFADMTPGETKRFEARMFNPASVPQTVKLYLAGMSFNEQGEAEVTNTPTDIGTWGAFEHREVTIGARETSIEAFTIKVPNGVDPGDHVGAVVVEHTAAGAGNIRTVQRVAVRLYVTLPGDARRDFVIDGVTTKKDSSFFTRELTVAVQLRNTGHVRLEPTVKVDGTPAAGPDLLMSQSTEEFVTSRPVRFWGGPVRMTIDAQTRSVGLPGPSHQLRVTTWVIPWHLLVLIAAAVGLAYLVRLALRRRKGRYSALQSDVRRIERLISQQNRNGGGPDSAPDADDAKAAIRAAIKQARRAGDHATAERLERILDPTGPAPPPGASSLTS